MVEAVHGPRTGAPGAGFAVPPLEPLDAILPSEPLLLMGAGPVPIPHAVARANGVVIDHLGATMEHVIRNLKDMARYAFQTQSQRIMGVAGPASAAMEMAITNLLWPGRRVLCLKTGTFSIASARWRSASGADVTFVEPETGKPVTADMVPRALAQRPLRRRDARAGRDVVRRPELASSRRSRGSPASTAR